MFKSSFFLLLFIFSITLNAQKFEVSYSKDVFSENFSGNVLLYLSKSKKNPKDSFIAIDLPSSYRVQVNNLKPGETITFDDNSISYPMELSNIERGEYYVQAVFDRNLGGQFIGMSPGNIYSESKKVKLDKDFKKVNKINCNKIVEDIQFSESETLKELKIKSKLLSDFNKKDVYIAGAVSLPSSYKDNPNKSYPVVFSVFGFGANYKLNSGGKYGFSKLDNEDVIVVYLDGNCAEGHSTYANSDVNGPWGDALVKEFIPELNKNFRTNDANFLYGHSSGGWTVLWLQINYPETFNGAWSSSPDQVDFRNWQNINIYETDNIIYDEDGSLLYDITIAGRFPIISSQDLYRVENVVYRGEQFHSFDAVFGKLDSKGNPIRIADPISGVINKDAVKVFSRYDISLLLRNNWEKYKGAVEGKVRISVGEHDNFYLHKAVHLFDKEMKNLNANIEFEYYAGDHFTIFTDEYKMKGRQFVDKCYKNWKSLNKK